MLDHQLYGHSRNTLIPDHVGKLHLTIPLVKQNSKISNLSSVMHLSLNKTYTLELRVSDYITENCIVQNLLFKASILYKKYSYTRKRYPIHNKILNWSSIMHLSLNMTYTLELRVLDYVTETCIIQNLLFKASTTKKVFLYTEKVSYTHKLNICKSYLSYLTEHNNSRVNMTIIYALREVIKSLQQISDLFHISIHVFLFRSIHKQL